MLALKKLKFGFPAASQLDFDFVRWLIEERTKCQTMFYVQVLTQARPELIGAYL